MTSDHQAAPDYPVTENSVTAAGLKVYYHTAGNPENPPLLFLHGWGIRWQRFGPWCGVKGVIEELQNHFYVIAPELPGLIRSEAPKTYRGYEEYAHIIHALVQAIGISQPVYLMGSSFGGTIATIYTRLFPQKVRHLILMNAILNFRATTAYPRAFGLWGQIYPVFLRSRIVPKVVKKLIINLFFGTPWKHITDDDLRRKQNMGDPLLYIYDLEYERIKVPTLLIWGEKDKKFPLSFAQEVVAKMPNATLVPVSGGHSVLYFHPREVISTTLKSLGLQS